MQYMAEQMVSVIVPVYNTPAEFLRTCVRSISEQTYKNIELILIDDGSQEIFAQECDNLKEEFASEIGGHQINS